MSDSANVTPFSALISDLAKNIGLETADNLESPIEFKVDDVPLTLAYDDRAEADEILIYASLGIVPKESETSVYRAMLEGNLFWSATGDATIGVNSDTREAIMAYRVDMNDLDGEILARISAHFLEIAQEWIAYLKAVEEEGADAAANPAQFNNDIILA